MERKIFFLINDAIRIRAHQAIDAAPYDARVEIKETKRTTKQNARFWAMLTDVAEQVIWHGQHLSPDDWKLVFLDALKREMRTTLSIDGKNLVNLGRSSSDLSVAEMGDLITLIEMFGAQHGVRFHDEEKVA